MGMIFKNLLDPLQIFSKPATPAAPTPPVAPTLGNSEAATDAAAQAQAATMTGGRTSTMLAGSTTAEDDAKKTSKILLGT